jgi:hypothetical protein
MQKELYIDIGNENAGGSLYRIKKEDGSSYFLYQHSTYDTANDEVKVYETDYPDFTAFWAMLSSDRHWFYLHPLYVHPEQRNFIQQQLQRVRWDQGNKKWQESHQRQWTKVLTDPAGYYRGKE